MRKKLIAIFLINTIIFSFSGLDMGISASGSEQEIKEIYENDFESYASDYNFRTTAGWTHSVAIDKLKILSVGGSKRLQVQASAANGYGQKTFEPVPLNENGGESPGYNATLVAQYSLARYSSDLNRAIWAAFTDSDAPIDSETLSAVTRPVGDTTTPLFKYGLSSTSATRDEYALYTDTVNGNTSAANGLFVKIRYEVKLTDETGAFVDSPTADIYVNDSEEPVISDIALLNNADKIDAIRVAGQVSNGKMLVDDVHVYVVYQDEAPASTPTSAPTPVPDHTVTVSIDDTKGMVLNMATGLAVKNGQSVQIADGAPAQFKVVAYGGYKIDEVTFGGSAPAGTGMFKYVSQIDAVTIDATLSVTFQAYAPIAPEVDSYNEVFVGTEDSRPVAVSYGTVHGQNDDSACGIILWNTADTDVTLEQALSSAQDSIHVFSATSAAASKGINVLGQFGVMVKDLPGGSYKMKTYVASGENVKYGSIVTFVIA